MNRDDLARFVWQPAYREEFIYSVADETEQYRACIEKKGTSCPILLTGTGGCQVTVEMVRSLENFFKHNSYDSHVADYVFTALQLDESFIKTEEADSLLDDLTA